MTNNKVNKTLMISTLTVLKNLFILIAVPVLFLCDVLSSSDVFKNKCKSYLNGREEELEGQETKTNLDEDEEEGLIEISLERAAKEVKKPWMSKEEYFEEIWEEIEEEEEEDDNNMIEIDISIGSIVTD